MGGRALCITGMPGCGKEELLHVADEEGIGVIRMGDVVREEAAGRGLPISDQGVGGMAHEERRLHGPGIWAARTLARIETEKVVIDGVRSLEEVDIFREAYGTELAIVAVHASPATRYARIKDRRREDDTLTEEEFRNRDMRELGWGLGGVIALADHVILNDGSLADFQDEARQLLKRFFR